ncbi:MAG: amylo-alpha-1,6-glucosidase [Candidatus Rokuibacteriota bacterium]
MTEPLQDDQYYIRASGAAASLPKTVIKHGDGFIVADPWGDFSLEFQGGLGFFFGGTRFLHYLELRLARLRPLVLGRAISEDNVQIAVDLTNVDMTDRHGTVPRNGLYIQRLITLYDRQLFQTFTVTSYLDAPVEVPLELRYAADYADIFEVRGTPRRERGHAEPPECGPERVVLGYVGRDRIRRRTELTFGLPADVLSAEMAVFRLRLQPQRPVRLSLAVTAEIEGREGPRFHAVGDVLPRLREADERQRRGMARITTSNTQFNALLARAGADLRMLQTETADGPVPYAGIPWFACVFGRDSLITALETLPFNPSLAASTLRFLARHQATVDDPYLDAEPGKILHEYRTGEMANCREIPFIPYYGSVDATPLFLMALAEYVRWTGDLGLARDLMPAAERALGWLDGPGDLDGDGYLEYRKRSPQGLTNQGWKDSYDAVMHASGELAEGPIALVEAQGYLYAARLGVAYLADALGKPRLASACRDRAERLQRRFAQEFWMPEEATYALALDGAKRCCAVVASNAAHALWTGVAPPEQAAGVAKRLLLEDMFTGWGVRTLASREVRFNPMSYHNGSVWPHDNAIAAAGFRRYGFTEGVLAVATALFEAGREFEHARLPELFCGFARQARLSVTRYPVACSPQAWAAGAPFHVLAACLGLSGEPLEKRITLANPVLPSWLEWLEVHGLELAGSQLDFRVVHGREAASVELIGRRGDIELVVRR